MDGYNDDRRKWTKGAEITLATWNIQTMLKPGKMKERMEEIDKAKIDVVAVQEIRWQGQGRIDKKDFSFFYSGPKERTGLNGTRFIVNAEIKKTILSFEPINERLCKMRIKGKFINISYINICTN
jgi:exonuclease III